MYVFLIENKDNNATRGSCSEVRKQLLQGRVWNDLIEKKYYNMPPQVEETPTDLANFESLT